MDRAHRLSRGKEQPLAKVAEEDVLELMMEQITIILRETVQRSQ